MTQKLVASSSYTTKQCSMRICKHKMYNYPYANASKEKVKIVLTT
mgnify:CR=1 FL=1